MGSKNSLEIKTYAMKKMKLQLLVLCFLAVQSMLAQPSNAACPCCSDTYRQFDFWLGSWEVYNKAGKKVGENRVVSMQDSCVLQENWVSDGQTGTSYNFYNRQDSTWNQVYIDNSGYVLNLKGRFENNQMALWSEKLPGKKQNFYRHRITWAVLPDGQVSQRWEIVEEGTGNILQTAFDGLYKRK